MAEVKWIKITTDMFDHDKLDFIESMPESDAIIVIWIRLLTLAGKANAGGYVLLTESIPYTEDMLSHRFRKPINTVKLALETLRRLNMIEFNGETILITNWEKHQNIDGLEKIREQTKKRVEKYRGKQKALPVATPVTPCNVTVTHNVTPEVTPSNATELELDLELDLEKIKTSTTTVITNAFRLYEQEGFGLLSQSNAERIGLMIDDYTERWVCEAMKEASYAGKRSLPYVDGILRRFKSSGVDEPWKLEKPKKNNHESNKTKTGRPSMPVVASDTAGGKALSQEERDKLRALAKHLDAS